MCILIIGANRGINGLCCPVNCDISQQLIFAKSSFNISIAVAPRAKFFDDPGGKTDRRVIPTIGQSLGFCGMEMRIGTFPLLPLLNCAQVSLFRFG